ncbi:MAG: Flp1 family type IVb pilin [Eubacterium sp.]
MNRIKNRILKLIKDESGMGVVEVVLIILVLVGLAFVFKNQISSIANGIYGSIRTQINAF